MPELWLRKIFPRTVFVNTDLPEGGRRVAAINIDGTTINTRLGLPKESGDYLPALSDQRKTQYRLSWKDLKPIIIDEISMVGNTTLLHIHQRLKEIFGRSSAKLFAGISIIAVGDLYQLPPIKKKQFLIITKSKLTIFVIHDGMYSK